MYFSKNEMEIVRRTLGDLIDLRWIPPFFDYHKEIILDEKEMATLELLRLKFSDRRVLFFAGNFCGGFNVKSVEWFVKDIVPRLQRERPVDFVVGSYKASEYFKNNLVDHLHVYSDFDSVKPFNVLADVVLILTSGKAGVKFKLMDAINFGKKIVSTEEGVYGSGFESLIPNTNYPEIFTRYIIDQLDSVGDRQDEIYHFFQNNFGAICQC